MPGEKDVTKSNLEVVVTMLAELAEQKGNQCHGEGYGVSLAVFRDGSGHFSEILPWSHGGDVVRKYGFDSFLKLAEILEHNEGVGFDEDGLEHLRGVTELMCFYNGRLR